MALLRIFMSFAITAMLIKLAMAVNYTVGGPNGGWDSSTNLQTWASSQSFLVGDNLVFQYTMNHDVLEVLKADYDSCQASNTVQSYNDGNTVIPLTSPGKRYFICGTTGHCGQGMKVEIDTLATSASPTASPSTPPMASPTNPPPQASPSSPPSSPVTPVSSPAPEASTPSPAQSPEHAPTISPPLPYDSPVSSPTASPDVPSIEPPTISLSPSGSSLQPPPSSANRDGFRTSLTMGFSAVMMMLLAL